MKAMVIAGGLPQSDLLQTMKKRGIETVLLDGSAHPIARSFADHFYQVDVFNFDLVRQIAIDEKVDFILTVGADQVLLVVAKVSEDLDLPCYIDYETARLVSDKKEMKRICTEYGIPTSQYVTLNEFNEEAVRVLRYPVVVKPVDAYSSRGVRKAYTLKELKTYFEEARKLSRSGGIIVEEFCQGDEISVDAFVVDGKAHILCVSNSDKIKDNDRFVIFRGRYPADNISPEIESQIADAVQKIADAFHLFNSPLLVQMISDGQQIHVLEYCTRTGGNMKYLLIKYSSGVDVIAATLDITLQMKPKINVHHADRVVMNDFIYCNEGIFDHLENFDLLVEKGIIEEYHCVRPVGFEFRGIRSSSDRIAGVTITGKNREEINDKQRIFAETAKVIGRDGKDLMRHDLFPDLQ